MDMTDAEICSHVIRELFKYGADQSFVSLYTNLYNCLKSRSSWSNFNNEEVFYLKLAIAMCCGLLPRGSFLVDPAVAAPIYELGAVHIQVSSTMTWSMIIDMYKKLTLNNNDRKDDVKEEIARMMEGSSLPVFSYTSQNQNSAENIFDDSSLKWFLKSDSYKKPLVWKEKSPAVVLPILYLYPFHVPNHTRSSSSSSSSSSSASSLSSSAYLSSLSSPFSHHSSFSSPPPMSRSLHPSPERGFKTIEGPFQYNQMSRSTLCSIHFIFDPNLVCPLQKRCKNNNHKQWSHWTEIYAKRTSLFGPTYSQPSISELLNSINDALLSDENSLTWIEFIRNHNILRNCANKTIKLCSFLSQKRIRELLTELDLFSDFLLLDSYPEQSNAQTFCEFYKKDHAIYYCDREAKKFSFPKFYGSHLEQEQQNASVAERKKEEEKENEDEEDDSQATVYLSPPKSKPSVALSIIPPSTSGIEKDQKRAASSSSSSSSSSFSSSSSSSSSASSPLPSTLVPITKKFNASVQWVVEEKQTILLRLLTRLSYQYQITKLIARTTSIGRSSYTLVLNSLAKGFNIMYREIQELGREYNDAPKKLQPKEKDKPIGKIKQLLVLSESKTMYEALRLLQHS